PSADRLAAEEAAQVVRELAGRRIARSRLLVQTLQADRLQIARDARLQLAGRDWLIGPHLFERFEHRRALERRPAGQAFIEDCPQGINIGGWPDRAGPAGCLLG